MIRWINLCNIVTIVRNPKHGLTCSTSLGLQCARTSCIIVENKLLNTSEPVHSLCLTLFSRPALTPPVALPLLPQGDEDMVLQSKQSCHACKDQRFGSTAKSVSAFSCSMWEDVPCLFREVLTNRQACWKVRKVNHSLQENFRKKQKRLLGCFRAHSCTKAAYFCVFGPMQILRRLVASSSRGPLTFDILFRRSPALASTSLTALRIVFTGFWEDPMTLASSNRRRPSQVRSCIAAQQIVQLHGRQGHTLHIF